MLTTADGLSDRAAVLVMEDHTGALWVAPQAGGLDRILPAINHQRSAIDSSPKHYEFSSTGQRRPASAFLETREGVLWSAARDGQVHMVKEEVFSPALPDDRRASKVLAMAEDQRGRIWLGGRNGLSVLDGAELQSVELGAPEVITALVTVGGTTWAGTESGRVLRSEEGGFEAAAAEGDFGRQPITSLLPDVDGGLWVGTMGSGLFHLRAGRVRSLGAMMSEVDPRITCVFDDRAGYLWLGTLGGICRAEKAKLLGAPSSSADSTLVLDRSDGLLTRECTRGGQPAGWRGRDGTLYFSTGNGVACVHPERLVLNPVPPPVVIEEASAGGHALASGAGSVQAGPGRSRLVFRYTALSFTAPERVRFRTQLEGLDETWRDAGRARTMAYEAVPPGHYRFHVVAENGDGVWNETGAALAVEVMPHFWETRWFQLGIALLAGALAVAIGALVMRARMQAHLARLEAQTSRAKERARIAQDLHDDLGASLTEISLLASLAAEERGPDGPADGTLPEVAAKAQALVGALDEIVWAVNPRHDTLRSLAEYLAAFGGKFLGHAGITLRRDVPRELPEISLDTERRHSLFLAVREALNNAVKHSGASEVWLRLHLDSGRLEIAVEDNGRGFDPVVVGVDGDGLGNLRSRLERIGGTCRIESQPSSGTKVLLSLPLG
jgi:signal transduction histidine kinase